MAPKSKLASRGRLIAADFVVSFMWAWTGAVIKLYGEPKGEVVRGALTIVNMFFFAFLGEVTITRGAAYNPLTVFSSAITGDFAQFIFTVGARVPAQVLGSIIGVRYIIAIIPEVGQGPRLNVDIHNGALTEGFLTFTIVVIQLALARNIPGNFLMRTWISSICKLVLQLLGSDLTGGVMNPASVVGWAYALGDHITKEHIFVYWLAPVEATLLAVWTFKLLSWPWKAKERTKSE